VILTGSQARGAHVAGLGRRDLPTGRKLKSDYRRYFLIPIDQ